VPGGDENAFETLFNLFYDRIYTLLWFLQKHFFFLKNGAGMYSGSKLITKKYFGKERVCKYNDA